MSDSQNSNGGIANMLSVLGGLGAILIFALILFVAYLPNRPDPVDADINAARQAKADEARAKALEKLGNIETAMQATVSDYQK